MDEALLAEARQAQERLIDAERDADVARAEFHRAVRRLHLHGASLRELASGLGLSHQRVHQIVESAGGSRRWLRRRGERPAQPPLACTFCGRRKAEVSHLIAGPGVFICEKCVGLARGVISSGEAAGTGADTAAGRLTAVPGQEHRAQCSFCGKHRHQVPGMAGLAAEARPAETRPAQPRPAQTGQKGLKTPAAVCTECLELCDEIIAEGMLPPR